MSMRKEQRLYADTVEINYAEWPASGPPLLFLHGLAARWQVFAPLIPGVSVDWRVYAPDLRGHGLSGRTPGRYRVEDFAGDVVQLLRHRAAEPAVLYGHSLGGWVALWIAAELPELVRAAVVADSAIYPDDIDPDAAVSYLADLPIALRSLAKSLNQLDPNVMEEFREGRMLDGYDADDLLSRVACPVLLLQANPALGGLMTDAAVQRALAVRPHAEHTRFDDLGHGLHVQDAHAVMRALAPFLSRL